MTTVLTRAEQRGASFSEAMAGIVRRLPWGLSGVVPASLLGFIVINGFTFGVDLGLLTILRSWVHLPLWLSITIAYGCAFGLSYVLNRALNFHSHSAVGPQLAVYVVVVVINYAVWIIGAGAGLSALGVEYHLARIIAGACEGIYMYCALRWIVFRQR
ncbi:GtrA family protein [Streptomyces sp. SID13031]|uniref:GtrA family protein n=1 Tax=Streptomyces sp. SID13031 TaxID=2706046 RepID=UPI0013CC91F7|nr:GtrA family protein [Streptomyces sp. SID13031]NEA34251.1 GtrA family protein [Streptomyces sp. SID13031]